MRKGGTLGVLLSILVINDNDRVLTMFMLSQVGASVRAHSRQCQSTRGLPAVVGLSQTKGLDLGLRLRQLASSHHHCQLCVPVCYFFDV